MMKEHILELLVLLKGVLPNADWENAMELVEYDEYAVAVELICTQLYENDIPVNLIVANIITELLIKMQLDLDFMSGIRIQHDGHK